MKEQEIKELFLEGGFSAVGFLSAEEAKLDDWNREWLEKGYHAQMDWAARNQDIRQDPASIAEFGKSLILLALSYHHPTPAEWEGANPISRYAWGQDYHKLLKKKAKPLLARMAEGIEGFRFRMLVDSAPLPEKILAQRAGLGFIGKNSLLIHPELGSYLFIGCIVTNLELSGLDPMKSRCGDCRICLESCPSAALRPNGLVDARRCLSYLTIEHEGEFNPRQESLLDFQLFGCDLCQAYCPFNQEAPFSEEKGFQRFERWQGLSPETVLQWSEEEFESLKINSPLKRAGLEGLKRNAHALLKKKG